MAITWTVSDLKTDVAGNLRIHTGLVTSDTGTYTTNGDALTLAKLGLHAAKFVNFETVAGTAFGTGYVPKYDIATEKLLLFIDATAGGVGLVEEASGVTVTTVLARFVAIGW